MCEIYRCACHVICTYIEIHQGNRISQITYMAAEWGDPTCSLTSWRVGKLVVSFQPASEGLRLRRANVWEQKSETTPPSLPFRSVGDRSRLHNTFPQR